MDFFILGNPRSGTTLLRLIINSHSLIGVPPESGFLHWWHKKYKDWTYYDTCDSKKLESFLSDILSSKKIETWNLNSKQLKGYIIQSLPKNYLEIISCVYRYYCNSKPIIGDKNNYYINHLSDIKEIVPDAKYIHIIRDGRDVACSYKNIKNVNQNLKYIPNLPSDIEIIAKEWNENVNLIESFTNENKSITIRYEDLISKPKITIMSICNFLEVEFEINMLNFHENHSNNEPNETIHWKKKTKQPIDSSNMKQYKNILSNNEITIFNNIAQYNLKKFSYEL